MNICIIGNSKRSDVLAAELSTDDEVTVMKKDDEIGELNLYDLIVLPVPSFKPNGNLNLGNKVSAINSEQLFRQIPKDTLVISCNYQNETHNIADLNKRDDFAFYNAVPTAEAAIKIAIENSDETLNESNILITGFGRVSKILADRLSSFNHRITICARSQKDLSYAKVLGFKVITFENVKDQIQNYDIIFQTVPALVISDELIKEMNKKSVIIELSSGFRGTDLDSAKRCGIKIIEAPALPEKIFPISAGKILSKVVKQIVIEQT